ncbi:unnamed protein product [Rhizophagus irregularis]|uniref:Uncharacterized protein n=1 Tax=Rhizophagus irregularis TaxID=588596 RepID=A0A916EI29_9GLOM|nr:unnamed protein product [Rhizophagus irregularis]
MDLLKTFLDPDSKPIDKPNPRKGFNDNHINKNSSKLREELSDEMPQYQKNDFAWSSNKKNDSTQKNDFAWASNKKNDSTQKNDFAWSSNKKKNDSTQKNDSAWTSNKKNDSTQKNDFAWSSNKKNESTQKNDSAWTSNKKNDSTQKNDFAWSSNKKNESTQKNDSAWASNKNYAQASQIQNTDTSKAMENDNNSYSVNYVNKAYLWEEDNIVIEDKRDDYSQTFI